MTLSKEGSEVTKAIVVYGSSTGNTEALAQSLVSGLEESGIEVVAKNVVQANVAELANYDVILLGSSTWYEGELQDDFLPFYNKMANISLAGKRAAAFGPGDRETYPDSFCMAVDMLEERLNKTGAAMVAEGLRIDRPMNEEMDDAAKEEAKAWALNIAHSL